MNMGSTKTIDAHRLKESRTRALSGKPNRDGLKPLSRSRAALRQAVEEADWLGNDERAESLRLALFFVEEKIAKGQVWEPEW